MPVAEAQERISSAEFAGWVAFYQQNPFGDERMESMLAQVCAVVANCSGKLKTPMKAADFIPKYGQPKRQSAQEIGARIKLFAQAQKQIAEKKEQREQKAKAKK